MSAREIIGKKSAHYRYCNTTICYNNIWNVRGRWPAIPINSEMMPMINREIQRRSLGRERLPSLDANVDICNIFNRTADLHQQE